MYSGGNSLCINKCSSSSRPIEVSHFFFSQLLGGAKGVSLLLSRPVTVVAVCVASELQTTPLSNVWAFLELASSSCSWKLHRGLQYSTVVVVVVAAGENVRYSSSFKRLSCLCLYQSNSAFLYQSWTIVHAGPRVSRFLFHPVPSCCLHWLDLFPPLRLSGKNRWLITTQSVETGWNHKHKVTVLCVFEARMDYWLSQWGLWPQRAQAVGKSLPSIVCILINGKVASLIWSHVRNAKLFCSQLSSVRASHQHMNPPTPRGQPLHMNLNLCECLST